MTPLSTMDVGHAQCAPFLSMNIATRVYVELFHKLCISIRFARRPESPSKHLLGDEPLYGIRNALLCPSKNIRPYVSGLVALVYN